MGGGCNILDLNDDCLDYIYGFLKIIDWCSLRETCTRFRTISDNRFDRQAGKFKLWHISYSYSFRYNLKLSEVERVLKNFGKFVKRLSIDPNHYSMDFNYNLLVRFLDRYCVSLRDLELYNFNLSAETVVQCRRLFSNLQRLVIDEWDNNHSDDVVSACLVECTSVRELVIFGGDDVTGDIFARSNLKSLKSFKLSGCRGISVTPFKNFLIRNCQLTQVKLFNVRFRQRHDGRSVIDDVADTLPKIEALSLNFEMGYVQNVLPVIGMTTLKKLEIHLEHVDYDITLELLRGLSKHNNIEDLHLARFKCPYDELVELLSSIKRLKILKFTNTNFLFGNVCETLATGLSNLEEIHAYECHTTSLEDMKPFVVHIPNLRRIVYNRFFTFTPLIMKPELLQLLLEIRQSQTTKVTLSIFMSDNDFYWLQCALKKTGMRHTLSKYAYALRLLRLDKEHRITVSEYGGRPIERERPKRYFEYDMDNHGYHP